VRFVAAAAVSVLVWVLVTHPGPRRLRMRLGQRASPGRRDLGEAAVVVLGIGAAGVVTLVGWGPGPAAVATSTGCVLATVVQAVRGTRRTRRTTQRADEVARACDLIGSLVAIGHIPTEALLLAAEDCPVLAPVAAADRVGADVPAALRAVGGQPGGTGLVRLAQAWEVSARTGAPLGGALEVVADAVRRDREVGQVVTAELAGPRASGQVLGVLPIVGLAAGFAMGGEPVTFFLEGVLGPMCLVVGIALACTGVLWTESLVERATPGARRVRGHARRRAAR